MEMRVRLASGIRTTFMLSSFFRAGLEGGGGVGIYVIRVQFAFFCWLIVCVLFVCLFLSIYLFIFIFAMYDMVGLIARGHGPR